MGSQESTVLDSSMLVLWSLVALAVPRLGQAAPTFLQGYPAVPISSAQVYAVQDTPDVQQAKAEFMVEFQRALDGLLYELAPAPVKEEYLEDTQEVKEAKAEFFKIFNDALNGIIATAYLDDTPEVKAAKEEFFNTFENAMNNLLTTVETSYLEDTPEVKAAKAGFFAYFKFVMSGFLDNLSPKPGHNVIPPEIASFYIKDEQDVAEEKKKLDKIYLDAVNELDETLIAIENALGDEAKNSPSGSDSGAVIEA